MSSLLSGLMLLGVAMGMLTYWIIMMSKDSMSLSHSFVLLISGTVTAIVLLILDFSFVDARKVVEFVGYLFTPAMVCLAIPLYQQIQHLKKNGQLILIGVIIGILGSAFSIILLLFLFGATHEECIYLLLKISTSAITLGLSEAPRMMIAIISIIVVATEHFGYSIISYMSKLVCKKSAGSV